MKYKAQTTDRRHLGGQSRWSVGCQLYISCKSRKIISRSTRHVAYAVGYTNHALNTPIAYLNTAHSGPTTSTLATKRIQ